MKLSERMFEAIGKGSFFDDAVIQEVAHIEALVDEQNKLLDTFRRKLDKLEQETVPQLEAENEALMEYVPEHVKREWEHYRALLTGKPTSDTPVSDIPASP